MKDEHDGKMLRPPMLQLRIRRGTLPHLVCLPSDRVAEYSAHGRQPRARSRSRTRRALRATSFRLLTFIRPIQGTRPSAAGGSLPAASQAFRRVSQDCQSGVWNGHIWLATLPGPARSNRPGRCVCGTGTRRTRAPADRFASPSVRRPSALAQCSRRAARSRPS